MPAINIYSPRECWTAEQKSTKERNNSANQKSNKESELQNMAFDMMFNQHEKKKSKEENDLEFRNLVNLILCRVIHELPNNIKVLKTPSGSLSLNQLMHKKHNGGH